MTDRSVKNIMSPRTKEQLEVIKTTKSQRIAEAALSLFASQGYEVTSISQIAREAGVSKGLIYNYFESKEHILKDIVSKVFESVWERLGLSQIDSLDDTAYRAFIVKSLDIVLDDLDHFRLYFAVFTQPMVISLLMDEIMAKSAPYLEMLQNYYTEKGYDDPALQMRYVGAVLDGIQMHIMLDPENFPVDGVKKLLVEQFT